MTLSELNKLCCDLGAPIGGDRNVWIAERIERLSIEEARKVLTERKMESIYPDIIFVSPEGKWSSEPGDLRQWHRYVRDK